VNRLYGKSFSAFSTVDACGKNELLGGNSARLRGALVSPELKQISTPAG
jgi:hypothetical protein